jgi:hypothetical protein
MEALTRSAITNVLGPVDSGLAAELAATGATEAELHEAYAWLSNDEILVNEHRPFPTGRVAQLIEILRDIELDPEE